jgi:hypothetical protein
MVMVLDLGLLEAGLPGFAAQSLHEVTGSEGG